MKVVVIGGSGLIGAKLVNNLRHRGHEVVAASRAADVNAMTGEGLAEAMAGAEVVVDVANSPSFDDKPVMEFFETTGRNLLAAEAAAGVAHHVALSIVGTDRLLASGYFRAKMAQENLIKALKIPYTIVRTTQFFEFVGAIAQSATDGQTVRLPPALMQPIVSDDVVGGEKGTFHFYGFLMDETSVARPRRVLAFRAPVYYGRLWRTARRSLEQLNDN